MLLCAWGPTSILCDDPLPIDSTAYDIHFIVNNKYYAIKIQEKFESFCIFQEISSIRSNYLQDRIFRYPISTRIIYLSTYNTRCRYCHGFDAVVATCHMSQHVTCHLVSAHAQLRRHPGAQHAAPDDGDHHHGAGVSRVSCLVLHVTCHVSRVTVGG